MYTLVRNVKTGGEKYLPICKACVNDGAQLVWSRGKKTNKLEDAHAKRKRKGAKRSNVRVKRTKNASWTWWSQGKWCLMHSFKASGVSQNKKSYLRDFRVVLSIVFQKWKCSRMLTTWGLGGGGEAHNNPATLTTARRGGIVCRNIPREPGYAFLSTQDHGEHTPV